MDEQQPLLSICIPTYNRDYLIEECLNKLCPVAIKHNVNIVISDNASPDNTKYVIEKFMAQYSNITYYRQEKNIGPDLNFEFVLKQSNTKYRWLFGDSAIVKESDLIDLLRNLDKNNFDMYIIGAEIKAESRVKGLNEKIYTDPNDLLSELGCHITWVSCLIYSSNIINAAYFERYYNSYFLQTGIILEYCAYNKISIYFDPKIRLDIIRLEKHNHWLHISLEIFTRSWFLFIMSLPLIYSFESKIRCIRKIGPTGSIFHFCFFILLRKKNYFNIALLFKYRYFIKQVVDIPFILLLAIACIPRWTFGFDWKKLIKEKIPITYVIYKKLKKKLIGKKS